MIDVNRYIEDGKVMRSKIARDIKYGILTKPEIDDLVSNKSISASFRGEKYEGKKPKTEWNKQYLEKLSYVAIAECFNADYLYYLYDVAAYVSNNKKSKKTIVWAVAIIFVLIIIAIVIVVNQNNSNVEIKETTENVAQFVGAVYRF